MQNLSRFRDRSFAIDKVADRLLDGTLILFLGSGVSLDFGLPDWITLVNTLRQNHGLKDVERSLSTDELQIAVDEVNGKIRGERELFGMIEETLYKSALDVTPENILKNKLMLAISSMLAKCQSGYVSKIITLNYDSILEQVLEYHGYLVKVIADPPEKDGIDDLKIYHPHGFIPHPDSVFQPSKSVILGLQSADNRIGNSNDEWKIELEHILKRSFCLFIGVSQATLTDRALSSIFSKAGASSLAIGEPLGIWFIKLGKEESLKEEQYNQKGIVPFAINDFTEIPEMILDICKIALDKKRSGLVV